MTDSTNPLNPVTPLQSGAVLSNSNPLPVSLQGTGVSSDATATAAAPSYSEGTANPLSQNLTGDLRTIAKQSGTWTVQPGNTPNTTAWLYARSSDYPSGATPITGNAAGTTGAVVGTLAGVSAKTTYICGFNVSAIGGTAAVGPVTVAGLKTSSMVFQLSSSAAGVNFNMTFNPPVPANAVNTDITITTTADGTATAVNVNSWGYQL